ncbi:MAG: hypothetical protein WBI28_01955 [Candidatus Omnitrophota bacterium]
MNKIMSCLFILVIMLSCLINTALAGSNSYSIVVSCTIPAIPGVNVPLVEDESAVSQNQVAITQNNQGQIENEQMLSSTQEGPFMITKSIYSR